VTRIVASVVVALLVLLAAVSLVMHDSFYAAMEVRPEDAGISEVDVVIRGLVYLGLPVVAAAVAAAGVFVAAIAARRRRERRTKARRAGRWLTLGTLALAVPTVVLVAGALAALVVVALAPGVHDFATGSSLRLLGALIVVLAFATVLALLIGFVRHGTGPSLTFGWLAIAVMTVAAVPALLLARSAGDALAQDARAGRQLQPGAFDPLQVRAQPACVLPQTPAETLTPVRAFVLLGESPAGGALLYDRADRRSFVIPAARLGVIGVGGDVCREPGEPVPLEVGTPAEDAALAKRFRPLLLFDSREPWRPLNIERFVGESFPDPPTRHLLCPPNGACRPIGTTADLTDSAERVNVRGRRGDGSDHAAPACPRTAPLLDCENDASAIYYHVSRQDRRVFVDYWWFLRFNHFPRPVGLNGPCGGRSTPGSQHEGDWEGVTVVSKFGRPEEIDFVVFSAHGLGFRYRKLPVASDKRPAVFVACGSHAAYPRACTALRGCQQTRACRPNPCRRPVSRLPEAPADGARPWHRNDDEACFSSTPCLLPLPTVPGTAQEAPKPSDWTAWPGRWGIKGGPRSPGRQDRFADPWDVIHSDRADFDPAATGDAPASG
jgi:hypothetical protein